MYLCWRSASFFLSRSERMHRIRSVDPFFLLLRLSTRLLTLSHIKFIMQRSVITLCKYWRINIGRIVLTCAQYPSNKRNNSHTTKYIDNQNDDEKHRERETHMKLSCCFRCYFWKIHRFDIHFSRCILLFDSLLAADNNDLLEYISVWSCCFHWLIFYFHLMRLGIEPHGKGAIVVVMHFHKWLLTIPLVPFIMAYSLCSCMFLFLNVKPMHCIYFTYGFFGSLISKYHTTVFFM